MNSMWSYTITVSASANGPFKWACGNCGGGGRVKSWILDDTANQLATLIEHACPECKGVGYFLVETFGMREGVTP